MCRSFVVQTDASGSRVSACHEDVGSAAADQRSGAEGRLSELYTPRRTTTRDRSTALQQRHNPTHTHALQPARIHNTGDAHGQGLDMCLDSYLMLLNR